MHADHLRLRVQLEKLADEAVGGGVGDGDETPRGLAEDLEEALVVVAGGEGGGPELYVCCLGWLVVVG